MFQGIHDRFLRDDAFLVRIIENNRDEEVCRRGMFLQMKITLIICQKNTSTTRINKWLLHLNKSGSDTLPLRKRSDFKQALSTLERLHKEDGEKQFAPTLFWKNKQ